MAAMLCIGVGVCPRIDVREAHAYAGCEYMARMRVADDSHKPSAAARNTLGRFTGLDPQPLAARLRGDDRRERVAAHVEPPVGKRSHADRMLVHAIVEHEREPMR